MPSFGDDEVVDLWGECDYRIRCLSVFGGIFDSLVMTCRSVLTWPGLWAVGLDMFLFFEVVNS